jgi:hypothetical protein
VLLVVDFEVTIIVAVQTTPGISPDIVILLSAETLELDVVNTDELSKSFVTVTPTVTPAAGIVEVTFTFIACEVPTTAKIFPAPGSTLIVYEIGDSVGLVGGTTFEPSTILPQDESKIR